MHVAAQNSAPAPAGLPAWQVALQDAVRDPAELLALLGLGPEWLPGAQRAAGAFPLRVPRGFVARMRRGDPHDPLLRQVLPLDAELQSVPGYGADPLGELAAMSEPGVLHKYEGRVLLVTTGACAVHCRYCFRRHFPYGEANPALGQWERALGHIAADASLGEVILSGGDPLALPDERLAGLARRLAAIPHLRRLRVHTRLPVVLPERVDAALLDWLCGTRLQPVLVIHANHPREIDTAVTEALRPLRERGVPLLNQAVLLRGVNDAADVLAGLSEALFAAGVLPYYLHLLDPVAGAAHFAVGEAEARRLHDALRAVLPGYLVPRLVREVPGAPSKVPL
jgi:EF-P beta-lysylation protein EpmB